MPDEEEYFNLIPWNKDEPSPTHAPAPRRPPPGTALALTLGGGLYSAYMTVQKGDVEFTFSEITFTKQSIDCVMEIELRVQDGEKPTYSQRIDLRSSSGRKTLATELNAAYGNKAEGYNWVLILNTIFNAVIAEIIKEQKPVSVKDRPYAEIPFLASPFLQHGVSNLIFAQSEAGKTWFALTLAICLTTGTKFLGLAVPSGKKTLFLDYEDDISTFVNRLYKLSRGLGLAYADVAENIHYYKPTGSLRANVEHFKRTVIDGGYDLIIIDAGGDAAGGSPSDEEKVLDLFNALEELKVTKLILHHEPKNVQNQSAAFYGSMYWKARSRVAWRLEVESENGAEKTIKASIQKRSNLPYIEPMYFKIIFDTLSLDHLFGDEEPLAPIEPSVRITLVEYKDILREKPLEQVVEEALVEYGELTVYQLAEITGRDRSVIQKLLTTHWKDRVKRSQKGQKFVWSLK